MALRVFWVLPILVIACYFITVSGKIEDDFPLCKLCQCNVNSDSSVDVKCTGKLTQLFNTTLWINPDTNVSCNYKSLTVENGVAVDLEQKFPASNITTLNLANNLIVSIQNDVFSNLQSMEILILSNNSIETLHPNAFEGLYLEGDFMPLKSLKILTLDHNKLHSLDGDVFEHVGRIENLSLSYNPFKILDQQTIIAITSLVQLKYLDLSYTQLSTLPDNFLHTPKYISTLDLSGNQFSTIPETLGQAQSLSILYLNNNPFTNFSQENGFPIIETLKILHLCYMPELKNISNHSLSNLINLEELYITDNIKLSFIHKAALSGKRDGGNYEQYPSIKKLHLENNMLTSIDQPLLLRWEELNELDLTNNPWTCECENQWMVDELIPLYLEIDEIKAKSMQCAAPIEMNKFTFYDIYEKNSKMRCLDAYGNRPERDGVLLVGLLAGVLISIPIILLIIYSYQRHWFGLFDNSPASFSRQFYKRTDNNEDF